VRLLYDDVALYVGVVLHDDDPSQIVNDRHAARCRPGRHGFVPDHLRHLPRPAERIRVWHQCRGIQYDAQVRDQGNATASWDGSWDVKTQVTESGLDG
jgi:hypothetical protein